MEALKTEAFKLLLFILPGIITLRVKTALSSHPRSLSAWSGVIMARVVGRIVLVPAVSRLAPVSDRGGR